MRYFLIVIGMLLILFSCGDDEIITPAVKDCTFSEDEFLVIDEINSEFAHGFETANPDQEESSLDYLLDYLGDSKVVGLGEATHGSAEFFKMKDKIFRGLVTKKNFKAIIFEIPWGNCQAVDDYVTNGIGTADDALNQTYYWVYDTEETRALAEWMREYNMFREDQDKIHFVGCDPQGPDFEIEKNIVYDYLKSISQSAFDTVFTHYFNVYIRDIKEYKDAPEEYQQIAAENAHWVYRYMKDRREAFIGLTGRYRYEVALMAAHVVKYREFMYRKQSFGQTRDSLMAVYSQWWQEILGHESKVAIWAHNFHVMDNKAPGAMWMGSFLRNNLEDDYKNVGFSFTTGSLNAFLANGNGNFLSGVQSQEVPTNECGTLNQLFSQMDADQYYMIFEDMKWPDESYFYLNERKSMYQMGAGFNRLYMRNYKQNLAVPELWDVMIHFDEVEASELK